MKTGNVSRASSRLRFWFLLLPLLLGLQSPAFAQTDFTIYDEALASGWQNWSWATVDTASTRLCQYGSRLDSGHRAALLGALPALCRRAGRHSWLPESHLLCARRNRRWASFPGPGDCRRHTPGRCTRKRTRGRRLAENHGAARRARRRQPRRCQRILVPGDCGRRFAHLLRRHHRAGVRRSTHTAAAGQRHEHLSGCAQQRLEQLELGFRQHWRARPRYTPDPAQSP